MSQYILLLFIVRKMAIVAELICYLHLFIFLSIPTNCFWVFLKNVDRPQFQAPQPPNLRKDIRSVYLSQNALQSITPLPISPASSFHLPILSSYSFTTLKNYPLSKWPPLALDYTSFKEQSQREDHPSFSFSQQSPEGVISVCLSLLTDSLSNPVAKGMHCSD